MTMKFSKILLVSTSLTLLPMMTFASDDESAAVVDSTGGAGPDLSIVVPQGDAPTDGDADTAKTSPLSEVEPQSPKAAVEDVDGLQSPSSSSTAEAETAVAEDDDGFEAMWSTLSDNPEGTETLFTELWENAESAEAASGAPQGFAVKATCAEIFAELKADAIALKTKLQELWGHRKKIAKALETVASAAEEVTTVVADATQQDAGGIQSALEVVEDAMRAVSGEGATPETLAPAPAEATLGTEPKAAPADPEATV